MNGYQEATLDNIMVLPSAEYVSEDVSVKFTLGDVPKTALSSDGTTTGPSPYLLESTGGQYVDKDKPAALRLDTEMGVLRGYVTRLQDDINVFLTKRIQASGAGEDVDADAGGEDENEEEDEEEGKDLKDK